MKPWQVGEDFTAYVVRVEEEVSRLTAERDGLITYEDAERIVRDRLDDITVDDNSRCHWAEVANALTHILGELRAARGAATPSVSDAVGGPTRG